jgi:hypothetical protein
MESAACKNRIDEVRSAFSNAGSAHLAPLGMEEADARHRRGDAASVPSPIFPASRRNGKGPAAGRIGAGGPSLEANFHGARSRRRGWPRRRARGMLGA